jgi:hypothetical protein
MGLVRREKKQLVMTLTCGEAEDRPCRVGKESELRRSLTCWRRQRKRRAGVVTGAHLLDAGEGRVRAFGTREMEENQSNPVSWDVESRQGAITHWYWLGSERRQAGESGPSR